MSKLVLLPNQVNSFHVIQKPAFRAMNILSYAEAGVRAVGLIV